MKFAARTPVSSRKDKGSKRELPLADAIRQAAASKGVVHSGKTPAASMSKGKGKGPTEKKVSD